MTALDPAAAQNVRYTTVPRVLALAKARQKVGTDTGHVFAWDDLNPVEQEMALSVAAAWLEAAIAAGIAPPAERPTDRHDAVYVDDEGLLYAEYRTMPESDGLLRLVWADRMAESKADLEDRGATFRFLGWCL
ncbi:hypothetical protein [Streptomyces sp. NPDC005799]|uniref:hypothetical protein n=1 Tax=Streptomyces sp. NPDC005799 TaxID=3154678 RepID=UPI0033CB5D05